MDRVVLLGVPIDALTRAEAVSRVCSMLAGTTQNHVMTPNNEMLVEASKNQPFHALLHRTALNIPDSTGLLWAARWTRQRLPERVTGIDTVTGVCAVLGADTPVFLLGAGEGVAQKAATVLQSRNPRLVIAGTYAGSPNPADAAEIVRRVNDSGAKLLLVAYGSPAQDLWIDAHRREMPSVRVAMGIGGTFDFLAGTKQRAPMWMRSSGLEWLYRFLQEPSRWRRMWKAVIVFPLMVITRPVLSLPKDATSPRG